MKKIISCLIIVFATLSANPDMYTLKLLTGSELKSIIPFVAQQRIAAFREYPYLYEGNFQEEISYLDWFAKLPHSAIAVAFHKDNPVGFVSGTSFADFDLHFKGSNDVFRKARLNPSNYYYLPEAIIVKEHRGASLAKKLYALIEQYAISKEYTAGCFVEESHEVHPLKPSNYNSLDTIFQKIGYTKSNLIITFNWLTLQAQSDPKDEEHAMTYWLKNFNN